MTDYPYPQQLFPDEFSQNNSEAEDPSSQTALMDEPAPEEEVPKKPSRKRKLVKLFFYGLFVVFCCLITFNQTQSWVYRNSGVVWPIVLKNTTPVQVEITFYINDVTKSPQMDNFMNPNGKYIYHLFGSTEYKFTRSEFSIYGPKEKPIKIAFPPVSTYYFRNNSMSAPSGERPAYSTFWKDEPTLTLKLKESKTLKGPDHSIMIGGRSFKKYCEGGLGFQNLVFQAPNGEGADEYLIGTVFPMYKVVLSDEVKKQLNQ